MCLLYRWLLYMFCGVKLWYGLSQIDLEDLLGAENMTCVDRSCFLLLSCYLNLRLGTLSVRWYVWHTIACLSFRSQASLTARWCNSQVDLLLAAAVWGRKMDTGGHGLDRRFVAKLYYFRRSPVGFVLRVLHLAGWSGIACGWADRPSWPPFWFCCIHALVFCFVLSQVSLPLGCLFVSLNLLGLYGSWSLVPKRSVQLATLGHCIIASHDDLPMNLWWSCLVNWWCLIVSQIQCGRVACLMAS